MGFGSVWYSIPVKFCSISPLWSPRYLEGGENAKRLTDNDLKMDKNSIIMGGKRGYTSLLNFMKF